jgi:ketosteroid isomerase-like protein
VPGWVPQRATKGDWLGNPCKAGSGHQRPPWSLRCIQPSDITAALEPLDSEIEWTEPAEFPVGGTYHGQAAVKAYLTQSRAAWAEVSSEPERFIAAGHRIVVLVHARVRPNGSNQWQDVRLADVHLTQ